MMEWNNEHMGGWMARNMGRLWSGIMSRWVDWRQGFRIDGGIWYDEHIGGRMAGLLTDGGNWCDKHVGWWQGLLIGSGNWYD